MNDNSSDKPSVVRVDGLGVYRNTMPALVDRLFEILRRDDKPSSLPESNNQSETP